LRIWNKRITLNEYVNIRKGKYLKHPIFLEQKYKEYNESKSDETMNVILQNINEIERGELESIILRSDIVS
jgi:hypothetical protein